MATPQGSPALRAGGRNSAGTPSSASGSGQAAPVSWSSSPVRERSDGSPNRPPPSAWATYSGRFSHCRPASDTPLARKCSSLAKVASPLAGSPVRRGNSARKRGSSRAISSSPRGSNQATTGVATAPASSTSAPASAIPVMPIARTGPPPASSASSASRSVTAVSTSAAVVSVRPPGRLCHGVRRRASPTCSPSVVSSIALR